VRDQEQRAVEGGQCALEFFDGGEVEVVRGLVEREAADSPRREDGELGPRLLARRQTARAAADMVCVEVELREQGSRLRLA
jgi:hypothetical protein